MNNILKRGTRFYILAALVVLAGGIVLGGCGGKDEGNEAGTKKKIPTVAVETAQKGPITRILALTGETVAVETVTISATVEGPISYCPWREGDLVKTSQEESMKVIEISRELYRFEVKAAEAALDVAKAKLEDLRAGTRPEEIDKAKEAVTQLEESTTFAKNDLERITKLVESGSLPGEALEKARVDYVSEQAKLAAAKRQLEMLEAGYTKTAIAVQEAVVKEAAAKLDLATARLNECVIFAPFSGTITRVYVRQGDMASMKSPLLEISDLSSLVIRLAVPEAHASTVREGMTAQVRLDAMPGRTFAAKVVRVYPDLDRRMRTRTIELSLTEPADLAPGMFARVQLALESVEDAVIVPQRAIAQTLAGGQIAYVVVDGRVVQRKIKTGVEQAGQVQVLEGVQPGEKVVVAGHENLRDGVEVRVVEPPKAQPGNGVGAAEKGGSGQ